MKYYGYIYESTWIDSKNNKHYYIGQHKHNSYDDSYKGSGVIISAYIKKYGKDSITTTILKECETEEELNLSEIFYIAREKNLYGDKCCNYAIGGSFGYALRFASDEKKQQTFDKIRSSVNEYRKTDTYRKNLEKLLADENYHKKLSDGIKRARADKNSKYYSEECKQKRSKAIRELFKDPNSKYNSEDYHKKLSKANSAKWCNMSIDAKNSFCKKQSILAKNRWADDSFRARVNHPNKKSIRISNGNDFLEFKTVTECNKTLHIDSKYLINNGGYIKTGKYKGWKIYYFEPKKESDVINEES